MHNIQCCVNYALYRQAQTHTDTDADTGGDPAQWQAVRDLIMNGEVKVIKYHLNPPTSCDPAISQTPTTDIHTINNPAWSQTGAALPSLTFRVVVPLSVGLKEEKYCFWKNKHKVDVANIITNMAQTPTFCSLFSRSPGSYAQTTGHKQHVHGIPPRWRDNSCNPTQTCEPNDHVGLIEQVSTAEFPLHPWLLKKIF